MTDAPLLWLQNLTLLQGPEHPARCGDALLNSQGELVALDGDARQLAVAHGLVGRDGNGWWLAPSLVDPHSVLEQPLLGRAETLNSLAASAAAGGYGQVALLPWGQPPRDHPSQLELHWPQPLQLHLWGSLCQGDREQELAPQSELLAAGAIGLAGTAELPPLNLLERSLQLGEMEQRPVLLAPRLRNLAGDGLVRQRVEALRGGWPVDPPSSETLPLMTLLDLQERHPDRQLVAMTISTAEAVEMLGRARQRPRATVHWWHLLSDSGSLPPSSNGWRLEPPLGGPDDRNALRQAVRDGLIDAVAVHHQALDPEEQLLPIDQRRAGLAGHGLVLPLLAQALVSEAGWPLDTLWKALCWGPSQLLGVPTPRLDAGSRNWLLFDPHRVWHWTPSTSASLAANQPLAAGTEVIGQIVASGLLPQDHWHLD